MENQKGYYSSEEMLKKILQLESALNNNNTVFLEAELLFWTEEEVRASGWMFSFSDLQVEPQYLALGFINCSTGSFLVNENYIESKTLFSPIILIVIGKLILILL